MKKIPALFTSYRTKVTLALTLALFFMMGLSNFLIYDYSLKAQFSQIRERLKIIAQTAAISIDGDIIKDVPMAKEGIDSSAYKKIARQLERVRAANPSLLFIYTLTKTPKPGIVQFVVDLDPVLLRKNRVIATAYPGDLYDASRFPQMIEAYTRPTADQDIMFDEWGATLSGYAPILDSGNKVAGILGVDMSANDVYLLQKEIRRRALLVLLLGFILSVILGLILSNMITKRIEELVIGTRHIAANELNYKVKVSGRDEVSEAGGLF